MNVNKHLLNTGEPKINEDNFNNNVEQREDSLSHIISVLYRWI
ncbi:17283_t:CDS:1, partial [Funneliformis caledonium]